MAGTIGIKIANGDFYPIIEENSPRKKRLVLTTAHDGQENVQIDLFRSLSKSMLDAQYIGSLVVESLQSRPRGDPSIEMIISCDSEGNITADAYDLDIAADGEHHTLNVSLKTIDEAARTDGFPDFDFGSDRPNAPASLYSRLDDDKDEARKFPWLIMGLATVFVVIMIVILWFLINTHGHFTPRHKQVIAQPGRSGQVEPIPPQPQPPAPQPPAPQPVPPAPLSPAPQPPAPQPPQAVTPPHAATPQPQVSQPSAPVPVIEAPTAPPAPRPQAVQRKRPPAPVLSYKVPAVIPKNGVVYQIQWGDTLWDISAAFYRNPWLYPRIARHNNIKNPDLIIAGFNVRIPPLN
ncbi:MAG: Hsp70 family protein [Treponema sp.]|nr:Hsp70 family protein [Treponema sp.]